MKAARLHEFGDPDVLRYEDAPRPELGEEEVLVRVRAAGINPLDWKIRQGLDLPMIPDDPFPLILGYDVSGTVEEVGANVTEFGTGDVVYGFCDVAGTGGSYAEYTVTESAQLATKPESLTHTEAAGVPTGAVTAWDVLFEIGGLTTGQRVLIHGAAGGVGHMAVQLANWKGADVVATASGYSEKFLRELGVDEFVDYREQCFESVVDTVDVVVDTVGGETQNRSFEVLTEGGVLVSLVSNPSEKLATEHNVEAQMRGGGSDPSRLNDIGELVADGDLLPTIGAELPLSDASAAHERGETEHIRGKIALRVRDG